MSHWNRWSRKKRVLLVVLATLVLTTSTWAVFSSREAFGAEPGLEAPVPPPEEVYIQQRENADGLGNTYVLVQLSDAQVAAKLKEGTADFLTIGTPENLVILRDDGRGGDTAAADRLYTGIASIDPAALQLRAREDQTEYDSQSSKLVPVFEGRAAVGVEEPELFDYNSFAAGKVVRFGPAVAFLEPETLSPSQEEGTPVEVSALSSESEGSPRLITAGISSPTPVSPSVNAFQNRVLMITNTNVVTDPARTWNPCTNTGTSNGVWTFNHLMTQMTGTSGIPPSDFVNSWLQTWLSPNTINQDPLPARARMNHIINQWPKLSSGKLDLNKSPLRLLAIAPRVDLRKTTGGGGSYSTNSSGNFLDAGELRFIFGFVAKKTSAFDPAVAFQGAAQINSSSCYALPFTVIFEYRVPKTACLDVKAWAQAWKDLRLQAPGTSSYRADLEFLTQQVVVANANPNEANGSALGQLRTNEVALDAPWELREFHLQKPASFLVPSTVEDTIRNDPASDFNNNANGTGLLKHYIQNVVEPLLPPVEGPIPVIPLFYQGQAFKAGDARVPETNPALITFHWNAPGLNVVTNNAENWARHRVSRASCNGCHRREVFTHFVHVNPANTIPGSNPALPAELSVFLTGINGLGDPANAIATGALPVSNPGNGNPKRNFDDLARREKDLKSVAKMSCSGMPLVNAQRVNDHFRSTGRLPDNLFEGTTTGRQISVAIDDILRNFVFEVH